MVQQDRKVAHGEALAQLRVGATALMEGRLEQAAEALVTAEAIFRRLDDLEHVAECRAELAEVQRQNGAEERAMGSYERAIALFRQVGRPVREATTTLSLGHVERQRGELTRAAELYTHASDLFAGAGNRRGQAAAALALGHVEAQRGHPDAAARRYAEAEHLYRAIKDHMGEADATRGAAQVLAAGGQFAQAEDAYSRARAIYHDRRDAFGEVDCLVGLGHLALDQGQMEPAATYYGDAIALARPVEYELGQADGALGLAEIEVRRGRLDQALASATQAGDRYNAANNALGSAEVSRILGEVQLRRGLLSQAITDFGRALRALRTLRAQLQYAQALLGAGEANRRRGTPRKADDLFAEARTVAAEVAQPALEASAVLGLGELARQRGQSADAERLLGDARRRFDALHLPAATAAALVADARLAHTRGHLDRARAAAEEAIESCHAAEAATGEPGPEAAARAIAATTLLAVGHLAAARNGFAEARTVAERQRDHTALAEIALGEAEAALQADELPAAVAGFNRAAELARQAEARLLEGLASVGLGRVLLRRELWEEAITAHQEMLGRFREAEDPAAQAQVALGVGEARGHLSQPSEARESFETAARLYRAAGAALGESAAAQAEGRVLFDLAELEAADGRYARAVELAEQVGRALARPEDRHIFFDSRALLYAEAIMVAAQRQVAARAEQLAAGYAALSGRPGRTSAARQLLVYEKGLPVRGDSVSEEQAFRHRATTRLLAAARGALK